MATQAISAAPSNSTDAYFRDWGKKLSDAMEAVGFTKTADTGQIDWATVTTPATPLTYQGYEIRQFTDGVQANNPIIVKVEYGSGGTNNVNTAIRFQVGRATDGAGTLVGEVSSVFTLNNSGTSTTLIPGYISSDGGRISVLMFVGGSYALCFYIERTKDTDATPNDDGVDIVGGAASVLQQYFPNKGLGFPLTALASVCCTFPATVTTASYGGNIGLFPILPNIGYAGIPSLGALLYFNGDVTADTSVSMSILGASHTYRTSGRAVGSINGNTSVKCLAMRYE